MGAWWRRDFRTLLQLLLLGASALACSSEGGESTVDDPAVATTSSDLVWDSSSRPTPNVFLNFKSNGTTCCPGGTNCAPCATSAGLITQAGYDKANDYYAASNQSQVTLEQFRDYYRIPRQGPQESLLDYRRRAKIVVYYNPNELGLGRELACGERIGTGASDYAVGCYVKNFGDNFGSMEDPNSATNRELNANGTRTGLWEAVRGVHTKGTVVISYDATRPAGSRVQFAAYGPDGFRVNKAQLDNMGARPVPQICMSCHGGTWDGNKLGANGKKGLALNARFLPAITSNLVFPNSTESTGYTLAEQEPALRYVNEIAWKVRGEGLTYRQKKVLARLYSSSPALCETFGSFTTCTAASQCTWQSTPTPAKCVDKLATGAGTLTLKSSGAQDIGLVAPNGFSPNVLVTGTALTQRDLYKGVLLRNCDTCHMAMEDATYTALDSYADFTALGTTLRAFVGVAGTASSPTWSTNRADYRMPHAQILNSRFWADAGSILPGASTPLCRFTSTTPGRPAADCFLKALGSSRPTSSLPSSVLVNSASDCGQGNGDMNVTGLLTGYNSGRSFGTGTGGTCKGLCTASAWCPGSEMSNIVSIGGTGDDPAPEFHGTRQECIPTTSQVGTCQSCGRIGQPPCQQVGPNCNSALNPECQFLAACHEGVESGGLCEDVQLTGGTAYQASVWNNEGPELARDGITSTYAGTNGGPGDYWELDWGYDRHVTKIGILPSNDLQGTRDFQILFWNDQEGWRVFDGATFEGAPTSSSSIIWVSGFAPARAKAIMILPRPGSPYLEFAEVYAYGW
jgi:hypothetical protein